MSDYENYREDAELDDFIISDEDIPPESPQEESPQKDRITTLTTTLRVNETFTSKVLRAHISVLVSALGGPDHSSPEGLYKLGHDALACLKDIKKWIRSVDDKNNSSEVALACAEYGLVKNDLTVILCQWDKPPAGIKRTKTTDKIMLSCLELLVLLTWPVDVNRKTLLKDYTSKTNARRAQLVYKQHILAYRNGGTLNAVVRLGLRALQMPREDREPRDINILRLILFFIRNILFIEQLPASKAPKAITNSADLPNGMNPEDIGLNAVLTAFDKNKVLLFLTSIAHSVQTEFSDESFGVLAVECLSLLTRGVKTDTLFSGVPKPPVADISETVPPASTATGMQLQDLLSEEDKRKRRQKNNVSTRHGRFGTLLTIQSSDNASYYTVSGQEALASTLNTLDKLDRTKQWHKTSAFKYDSNEFVKNSVVYLNQSTLRILKVFVDELLISGSYNNLLSFVGRHITNLSNDHDLGRHGILDSVDPHELASYFMTISWFFSYKRDRTNHYLKNKLTPREDEDSLDYGSVGSALNEVNFILLTSYFRSAYEAKDHDSLHVALICMRGMLLISNAIFTSERSQQELNLSSEDDVNQDRELAEGIIRKLFSQKQFLDMMVNIPKQAAKHSPEYLSVVVSVVHIVLKCFETLANEDVKLYINARRKMNKLAKSSGLNSDMDRQHWHLIDRGSDEEADEEEIRYINQERKLDFKNTEVRFFHTDTVSTHIAYLSRYEDMTHEEIKRGISYFHRLFVVRKDFAALYRLDFMSLLYRLRSHLPRASNIRRHVEEFIVYFMKKFKGALDRFPVAVELLFPRFESLEMKCFLSTGDLESATASSTSAGPSSTPGLPKASYFAEDAPQPRAAVVLSFNEPENSLDRKIGILVYHLIKKKNVVKALKFLTGEFERLAKLKEKGIHQLMLRLNLSNRKLLINEAHLRLLLETVGFELPYLQNDETILKPSVTASTLEEAGNAIEKWLKLHEDGIGDVEPFLDQIHTENFTQEQLDFGVISLANLRAGKPADNETASIIGIDKDQLDRLIGLAKRKEYDEMIAAQYSIEDEDYFADAFDDYDDIPTDSQRKRRTKSKATSQPLSDSMLDDIDRPKQSRRSRREALQASLNSDDEAPVKSAEMVHDSDDDSDDEKVQGFYEKEEQLRQLISSSGGIMNKEQLEVFKQSWQKMMATSNEAGVKSAVSKASSLFVADSDDEDDNEGPPGEIFSRNISQSSGSDENLRGKRQYEETAEVDKVSRKRRIVLDDDEDE